MCIKKQLTINKFKEIISIKSQLHQQPQFNSCSAHHEPRTIDIKNNKIVIKKLYLLSFKNK